MSRNLKAASGIVLMAFAAACFFLSGKNGSGLPELPAWTDEPDYVLVQKGQNLLFFTQEEGRWFMGKKKIPADEKAVCELADRIRNLNLTEKASNDPEYEKYGLDSSCETVVIIRKGKKLLSRVSFGTADPSGNFTFVKIMEHPGVFTAQGTFTGQELNPDAYRDRDVCHISPEDIEYIEIISFGKMVSFKKKEVPAAERKTSDSTGIQEWVSAHTPVPDQEKVMTLVRSVAGLRASGFTDEFRNEDSPAASVSVKAGKESLFFSLFPGENGKYVLVMQDLQHPMIIDSESAEKIFIKNIADYEKKQKPVSDMSSK